MRAAGIEPRYQVTRAALHISAGNSKTGAIRTFNKLAGNGIQLDGNGTPITNVFGSCPFNCAGCYACASQALCRENVIRAWAENTLLAQNPAALKIELFRYFETHPAKYDGEPFRIHSSGEFQSVEELRVWNSIAGVFEFFSFYTYTKRFDLIQEFYETYGYYPTSININLSECEGVHAPAELKRVYGCFVWDTGQPEAANLAHCPAVLKPSNGRKKGARNKGVTCADCGRCMYHSRSNTAVYNH